MPHKNGLEAAAEIRAKGVTTSPILALTGNASTSDQAKCLRHMNGFLTKPYKVEQLFDKFQELLGRDYIPIAGRV